MSWDTHWDQRPEESRRLDAALAGVERVRALHAPLRNWLGRDVCLHCTDDEVAEDYPCPTIRALDGATP